MFLPEMRLSTPSPGLFLYPEASQDMLVGGRKPGSGVFQEEPCASLRSQSLDASLQNPKTLLLPYKEALGLSPPSSPQWQDSPCCSVPEMKPVMVPSHLRLLTPATLPSNLSPHICSSPQTKPLTPVSLQT